jgi:DNA-binding CsgD family transcriptional regulator
MGEELMAGTAVPNVMMPLRALFDVITDGVLVTDGTGYRTYANPALNSLVGDDARLPMGTLDPPKFLPEDQHERYRRHMDLIAKGRITDGVLSLDWEILDAHSRRVPVVLKLLPVYNGRRDPAAVFWLVLDGSASTNGDGPVATGRRRSELEEGLNRIASELQRLGIVGGAAPGLPYGRPELDELSHREREVLELLLGGQRVVSIADQLCLSGHTVRNHLKSIFRKLDVHSQAELIELFRGGAG